MKQEPFRTTHDLAPGKTVLARIDINSPVADGQVQDNKRFERHAQTVQELLAKNHAVALMAHQGRPGRDTYVPLEQHAQILAKHLGQDVQYVDDVHGQNAVNALRDLRNGEVLLLENTRFSDHELTEKRPEEHAESPFVTALKDAADCYVNDAYSAAHRAHASLVGFPHVMEAYAGPVMHAEYANNTRVQNGFDGEVTMVLGGKKAEDVLHVMERLVDRVDNFLVGGIIGELFLRAEGYDVGYDVDDSQFMHHQWLDHRDRLKRLLRDHRNTIYLPRDLAFYDDSRERAEVSVHDAAKHKPYWDIGRDTVDQFTPIIQRSDAVFVKGALGVFEDDKFSYGTRTVIDTIGNHDCFSVIGGGDTSRCIDMYDLDENNYSHVSIAGGAYIRALAGEELAAVEALKKNGIDAP